MKIQHVIPLLLFAGCSIGVAQTNSTTNVTLQKQGNTPAQDLLSIGLSKAKSESRKVFLLYGFKACPPCRVFEQYLTIPDVSQIFGQHFVLVKIDTVAMPDGDALQKEYGPLGAPAWASLNYDS